MEKSFSDSTNPGQAKDWFPFITCHRKILPYECVKKDVHF
jgi:hypothetical protein